MYIQMTTSSGYHLVPAETRLLSLRKIFLSGEITSEMAVSFCQQLMLLSAEDNSQNIDIMISSPGGDVNAGLLIIDAITSCSAPIRTYCLGQACSMAAVVFACGGERYMLPNSEIMLHEPMLGNRIGGNCTSIRMVSETLMKVCSKLNGILAQHCGKAESEIEAASSYDHFFSAEEAVSFGLCDKIIDFKTMEVEVDG